LPLTALALPLSVNLLICPLPLPSLAMPISSLSMPICSSARMILAASRRVGSTLSALLNQLCVLCIGEHRPVNSEIRRALFGARTVITGLGGWIVPSSRFVFDAIPGCSAHLVGRCSGCSWRCSSRLGMQREGMDAVLLAVCMGLIACRGL
jgi:hypothetical protein